MRVMNRSEVYIDGEDKLPNDFESGISSRPGELKTAFDKDGLLDESNWPANVE